MKRKCITCGSKLTKSYEHNYRPYCIQKCSCSRSERCHVLSKVTLIWGEAFNRMIPHVNKQCFGHSLWESCFGSSDEYFVHDDALRNWKMRGFCWLENKYPASDNGLIQYPWEPAKKKTVDVSVSVPELIRKKMRFCAPHTVCVCAAAVSPNLIKQSKPNSIQNGVETIRLGNIFPLTFVRNKGVTVPALIYIPAVIE